MSDPRSKVLELAEELDLFESMFRELIQNLSVDEVREFLEHYTRNFLDCGDDYDS
jgi:hypothetical protein